MNKYPIQRTLVFILATILLMAGPLGVLPSAAQAGIQVSRDELHMEYPSGMTFELEASSSSEISRVTLVYGSSTRACQNRIVRQTADFTPGTQVRASWEWEFKRGGVVPPGVELWWQWEIETAAGSTLTTEKQTQMVNDQRRDWQQLSGSGITFQWYEGSQAFAQQVFDIAVQARQRLSAEMGIETDEEFWITAVPTFEEVTELLIYASEWAGGVAFVAEGGILIGLPPGNLSWAEEVVPHELAHLVVGRVIFNCWGIGLPTWLSEGLSVFAEGELSESAQAGITSRLERGTLPELRSLAQGFSAYGDDARLAYDQSGMVVAFLIETYGPDRMGELLKGMQSGVRVDPALQQVYGFDTHGLDLTWRAALGSGPAPTAGPTPTRRAAFTAVPTLALWTAAPVTAVSQVTPTPLATAAPEPSTTPMVPSATAVSPTQTPEPVPTLLAPTLTPTTAPVETGALPVRFIALIVGGVLVLAVVLVVVLLLARR